MEPSAAMPRELVCDDGFERMARRLRAAMAGKGEEPPVLSKALAASLGSVVTSLTMTPFDVVKTRMQAQLRTGPLSPVASSTVDSSSAAPGTLGKKRARPIEGCARTPTCNVPSSASCSEPGCARPHVSAGELPPRVSGSGVVPRGTVATFAHLVRTEGLGTLWSGLAPTLLMSVPSTMLYFTAYEELKGWIQRGQAHTSPFYVLAPLGAGTASRTLAAAVVAPLELVRTKMQSASSPLGVIAELRSEIQSPQGWRSLWRGLGPTLFRDVPFSAVYWLGYERVREMLSARVMARLDAEEAEAAASAASAQLIAVGSVATPHSTHLPGVTARILQHQQEHHVHRELRAEGAVSSEGRPALTGTARVLPMSTSIGLAFIAGATSGMVAATLTTPFDVAKTRRQIRLYSRTDPNSAPLETTALLLRRIWRDEGPRGLFAGLGARVAKVTPACAIMIASYEGCKRFLGLN